MVTLERTGSLLKPVGKIPIHIVFYDLKMIEITAKLADGWMPESHTPTTYKIILQKFLFTFALHRKIKM